MRYAFSLPVRDRLANYEGISRMVEQGERLGFHECTMADHIVFPTEVSSKYPYAASGEHPSHGDALEALSLMAFVAGRTERLRIATSVLIVPYRNPLLVAKMIATIDVVSRGRVTLGIGVGWLREEFEALQAPDFARRGAVTDEFVEIYKKIWSESPTAFEGKYYSFPRLNCEPAPVQTPHPPIWIGGHSKPALRRTARYGDGWNPLGTVDTAILAPPELTQHLDELKRMTEAEGRDFSSITIAFIGRLKHTKDAVDANDRRAFTGSTQQILDDVEAYRRVGVTQLGFDFRTPDLAETLDRTDRFAAEIMSATRG